MIETVTLEEALWQSAKESFETMIMLPIERSEEINQEIETSKSIIASIAYQGPIKGAVTIKCDCQSADKVARSMLMMTEEDELAAEDIHDAIGEATNLVIGGLKSRIAKSIGQLEVSIPVVMEGKEVVPAIGSNGEMIEIVAQGDGCKISFIIVYREPNDKFPRK